MAKKLYIYECLKRVGPAIQESLIGNFFLYIPISSEKSWALFSPISQQKRMKKREWKKNIPLVISVLLIFGCYLPLYLSLPNHMPMSATPFPIVVYHRFLSAFSTLNTELFINKPRANFLPSNIFHISLSIHILPSTLVPFLCVCCTLTVSPAKPDKPKANCMIYAKRKSTWNIACVCLCVWTRIGMNWEWGTPFSGQ